MNLRRGLGSSRQACCSRRWGPGWHWTATRASSGPEAVTPEDIERAMPDPACHDPRRQRAGVMRVVVAEQRDINLLLQHAAARFPGWRPVRSDARQAECVLASLPLRRPT
jgi:hypothetical protein